MLCYFIWIVQDSWITLIRSNYSSHRVEIIFGEFVPYLFVCEIIQCSYFFILQSLVSVLIPCVYSNIAYSSKLVSVLIHRVFSNYCIKIFY